MFASLKDSGTTKSTRDQILDFKGKDDIVLSGLDADTGQAGDQAFRIDDGGGFEAGEIRITTVNAGVKIELNVDGDAKAELSHPAQGLHRHASTPPTSTSNGTRGRSRRRPAPRGAS